ncbi:aminotransferase class I/II-fold pyridoxal phosphate-dependent enzyme (plasmid) [Legionella lytica]|uniref:Aminotransferase class I/II-fold pyridoxal phosphate-dependent enzyme n=1 Tax=Legionella lytica TaxID=96232 RepID=A0ABY4YDD8_9GAMM|nr:aminotransferase class I/II-fold pyridoxal phosphate-dependent enzyme [Legionella lytica]USQ15237.1 aminotransferase class I/II-fold pyridoxal phosphate-dependent enzyme [Legionella lytica]USQ15610.1 aminotransferase class I/II-fold pyridoxal phosphate-dependent enzyme [Legionella lytica]
MLTPEGSDAGNIDRIMLLSMWAKHLDTEQIKQKLIYAGMGKPTFRINPYMVQAFVAYWDCIQKRLGDLINKTTDEHVAIDYGDPRGEEQALLDMAKAMTQWYSTEVSTKDLLFTVGGAGALKVIFDTFNEPGSHSPQYRVITPFPYYTLYANERHILHPIEVMNESGYRLSLNNLRTSIEDAKKAAKLDGIPPKVLLLCNPNNPLGTVLSVDELGYVATVLREHPDLNLVIDEAYAEMVWLDEKPTSILELAPDLKERVTILRSATKAHSTAGERMALLMNFNPERMTQYRTKNISMIGHAPRSAQIAYASAMSHFNDKEANELRVFYEPKLRFVQQKLGELNALMPDPEYRIEGTFYVMADLSDLIGMDIPIEASAALGHGGAVNTCEELVYSLLFKESIMLAPSQYFGLAPSSAFCRITCSGSEEDLSTLMDRLGRCLLTERVNQRKKLLLAIEDELQPLELSHPLIYQRHKASLDAFKEETKNHVELVEQNKALQMVLSEVKEHILSLTGKSEPLRTEASQSFFMQHQDNTLEKKIKKEMDAEWIVFIDEIASEGPLKEYLLNLPPKERMSFKPWTERLALKQIGDAPFVH